MLNLRSEHNFYVFEAKLERVARIEPSSCWKRMFFTPRRLRLLFVLIFI